MLKHLPLSVQVDSLRGMHVYSRTQQYDWHISGLKLVFPKK